MRARKMEVRVLAENGGTVSLAEDLTVLKQAQAAADSFLSTHPDPEDPDYGPLFGRVRELFSRSDDTFN